MMSWRGEEEPFVGTNRLERFVWSAGRRGFTYRSGLIGLGLGHGCVPAWQRCGAERNVAVQAQRARSGGSAAEQRGSFHVTKGSIRTTL